MYYYVDNSKKYLIFPNEEKILTISQNKSNNNNDIKNNILTSAVLLYANEQELNKLFSSNIIDEYELKKYYLVNKKWIETFKNFINYNQIYNILSKTKQYKNYKGYEKNMEDFYSNENLKNMLVNINNIPNNLKNEIKLYPEINNELIENSQIKYPKNFELIPKSLFNLFKQIINIDETNEINQLKLKYKVLIGNLNLFIQSNENSNSFYVYGFNNKNKSYSLYGIMNFSKEKDFYIYIETILKQNNFVDYIINNNYDINKINMSQDILYFCSKVGSLILKYDNQAKIEITRKFNYNFYKQYIKWCHLLKTVKDSNMNLSNINNIDIYLSQNNLMYFNVFIIESN
jgi:hypothetical protein